MALDIKCFLWIEGPSWPWSYGSWIYSHLCNRCLSPLKLWVRILLMARCTWYKFTWWSLSVTCGRSVVFSTLNLNPCGLMEDKVFVNSWTLWFWHFLRAKFWTLFWTEFKGLIKIHKNNENWNLMNIYNKAWMYI